jgi:hypothetical protein
MTCKSYNRLLRVPRRPWRPRAQAMTPAKVAGPASPNSAIEVQLQCKRCLRVARIVQSVTLVTVIHLTASAQSRVATLHLIVHELLVIAMPAPHGRGGAHCREPDVRVAHRKLKTPGTHSVMNAKVCQDLSVLASCNPCDIGERLGLEHRMAKGSVSDRCLAVAIGLHESQACGNISSTETPAARFNQVLRPESQLERGPACEAEPRRSALSL